MIPNRYRSSNHQTARFVKDRAQKATLVDSAGPARCEQACEVRTSSAASVRKVLSLLGRSFCLVLKFACNVQEAPSSCLFRSHVLHLPHSYLAFRESRHLPPSSVAILKRSLLWREVVKFVCHARASTRVNLYQDLSRAVRHQ